MEEKRKTVKKTLWLAIVLIQTILLIGISIWAITQKVEAEKQLSLTIAAKKEALLAKKECIQVKQFSEELKKENLNYKVLYEKVLTSKK